MSMQIANRALDALTTLTSIIGEPTEEQRATLATWPGWGPLTPAFAAQPEGGWAGIADRLTGLIPEADLNVARDVIDTSFYTGWAVAESVFTLLRAAGFTGGRILEPGCGSGNFMSLAPADMDIQWTGVEIDPTAARFARALHPGAQILNKPLEKVAFKTGGFDAVVGNVPFSETTVYDPEFQNYHSLHEYFILRALDAVKPGGYVVIVTSRHILDGDRGLTAISEKGDLIAAIRLPNDSFEGTGVVADILAFRKPMTGDHGIGWVPTVDWVTDDSWYGRGRKTATVRKHRVVTGDHHVDISGYFADHTDCIAGTPIASGYSRVPLKVESSAKVSDIRRATAAAAQLIIPSATTVVDNFDDVVLEDELGHKEGSYHLVGTTIMQVQGGRLVEARNNAELRSLIPLRDAAVELIDLESHPERPDSEIAPARAAALALYEGYVKKYGPLNRGTLVEGKADPETGEAAWTWRRPTMGGFRKDPDYVAVMALEQFSQDSGEAKPAPILLRRVGAHPPRATSAGSAEEALAITLGECGRVDVARVAELLGVTSEDAITQLGDLVFTDPATRVTVTARDYLSGNIRVKLAEANAAAQLDDGFWRNVHALDQVMPADLGPLEIRAQLGATWISDTDMEQFVRDVFKHSSTVTFIPAVSAWEADSYSSNPATALTYGTSKFTPIQLLSCGLNGKAPVVFDEFWRDGRTVKIRNQVETLAAEEALRTIQERFAIWVWEDDLRSARLCAEYNRRFNSHVVRRGDGSYLTFPGLDEKINLWSWQRDAVDRLISDDRVLIGHPVGSGKSKSMITGALTLRRMGLARKPLVVVPNHLLEQMAREAQQAYPTGKFLIATRDDLTKDARRLFAARCATGDWDAVIITQQAFTSIGVNPDTEQDWLEQQKSEYRWHLMNTTSGRTGAKKVAAAVRKLEQKIAALRDGVRDPNQVMFEQLGVDYLMVDEAHNYRRLQINTRAEGFSLGSSKRATDLLLKIDTLAARYPGKPIVGLFTGTPWSNTLAETFVWQRYLQPNRLVEAGVDQFDSWAATFVRYESKVEVTPDGSGFRLYRRPAAMQNVPELRLMLAESADLLTADEIGLERPDGTWENVVVQQSEQQAAFVRTLAQRADDIRNSQKQTVNGVEDNMLMVCNDGRKVSLDPALVGINEVSPAVSAAAKSIARIHFENADRIYGSSTTPGALQLVLCDIGTPHPGDPQTYGRLRAHLVKLGVPAEKIRFIHEASTDKARDHLFALAREGAVSVLIGSTEKVGVGTNIQTRLVALHHLDAPWRPSDIEQREGRALRPGNLNTAVGIYRYLTEGSFQSFIWQHLERKQRFISQMYVSSGTIREIEDVSEAVLNYAEVKALAAGNPDLLRQAELGSEVRRLRTMRAVFGQGANRLRREAEESRRRASELRHSAEKMTEALESVTETGTMDDAATLEAFIDGIKAGHSWSSGQWRGLDLRIDRNWDGQKPPTITLGKHYRSVYSFPLNGNDMRMKSETLVARFIALVDEWIVNAAKTIPESLAKADRLSEEAVTFEATAESAGFEHEDELLAAELDLARVEAAINQQAEERLQQPAAAA